MTKRDRYDVVIVGGGTAGLGAALTLSRARRAVLVIDSGTPRNAPAGHVHNYLGREGTPPGELLAIGRGEVEGYGGEVVTGEATSAHTVDGGFRVELGDGGWVFARRLLVTTGLTDGLPEVAGLAELWGTDVLHCPYCHGWEVRDQAIGVLATGPMAVHQTLMFRQWSADVTLFLNASVELTDEQAEQLAARRIAVVDGQVAAVETADGRLSGVRLTSGEVFPRQALVVAPRFTARAEVLVSLGIETEEREVKGLVMGSFVPADPNGATAVPGVWVAGNVTDLKAQVIVSAAAGLNVATMINMDLIDEDTRDAVIVHRAFSDGLEREVSELVLGNRRHGL